MDLTEASDEAVREALYAVDLKSVQPQGRRLYVRALPAEEKSAAGIILPGNRDGFYGERAGHSQIVRGHVLGVGPKCRLGLKVGDIVLCTRLAFMWTQKTGTGYYGRSDVFYGFVLEDELLAVETPEGVA